MNKINLIYVLFLQCSLLINADEPYFYRVNQCVYIPKEHISKFENDTVGQNKTDTVITLDFLKTADEFKLGERLKTQTTILSEHLIQETVEHYFVQLEMKQKQHCLDTVSNETRLEFKTCAENAVKYVATVLNKLIDDAVAKNILGTFIKTKMNKCANDIQQSDLLSSVSVDNPLETKATKITPELHLYIYSPDFITEDNEIPHDSMIVLSNLGVFGDLATNIYDFDNIQYNFTKVFGANEQKCFLDARTKLLNEAHCEDTTN